MPRTFRGTQSTSAIAGGTLLLLLSACCGATAQTKPQAKDDPAAIIARSVEANNADWKAAPDYECTEEDKGKHETLTYDDKMILGSPYQELIAVNREPLSAATKEKEQEKLNRVEAERRRESPERRAKRTASYRRERERDHTMLAQLTMAFNFKLLSQDNLEGHQVYVLQATPKPGYRPPNHEAEVLTGMEGKLWIDTASFQWVKVEAQVVHPVSIDGFLARVEPGTSFELEQSPVGDNIWLVRHFSVHSSARVLALFPHDGSQDQTYSNCKKIPETDSASSAK